MDNIPGLGLFGRLSGRGVAASQQEEIVEKLWKELKPLQVLVRFVWRVARKDIPRYKFLILGVGGLVTLGAVRRRTQTALQERMETARDEAAHRKRMKDTRRAHAGPLLRASADLNRYLKSVLAPPGIDFVRENFPEKPDMVLVSSMYIFTRFVYYRWLLYDQLKFEHVSPEDSWQWVIERLLWGLAMAAGSKQIRMEEYVRVYHLEELSETDADAVKLHSFKPTECGILRTSLKLSIRREYPLRLSTYERDAMAELMERAPEGDTRESRKGKDEGAICECHRYVEFASKLKAALAAANEGEEHPWVPYFIPVWKDLVRFTTLQMQPYAELDRAHLLELVQFRVRLRALQHAISQLTQVLSLPLEAWNLGFKSSRRRGQGLSALPSEYLSRLRPSMRRRMPKLDAGPDEWLAFLALGLRVSSLWEIVRTVTWARGFPMLCRCDRSEGEVGHVMYSKIAKSRHGAEAIRQCVWQAIESDGAHLARPL